MQPVTIMEITHELILHLEELSKIKLNQTQRDKIANELEQMLSHFKNLSEAELGAAKTLSERDTLCNVTRADQVAPSLSRSDVLQNADSSENGMFTVPMTFETEE